MRLKFLSLLALLSGAASADLGISTRNADKVKAYLSDNASKNCVFSYYFKKESEALPGVVCIKNRKVGKGMHAVDACEATKLDVDTGKYQGWNQAMADIPGFPQNMLHLAAQGNCTKQGVLNILSADIAGGGPMASILSVKSEYGFDYEVVADQFGCADAFKAKVNARLSKVTKVSKAAKPKQVATDASKNSEIRAFEKKIEEATEDQPNFVTYMQRVQGLIELRKQYDGMSVDHLNDLKEYVQRTKDLEEPSAKHIHAPKEFKEKLPNLKKVVDIADLEIDWIIHIKKNEFDKASQYLASNKSKIEQLSPGAYSTYTKQLEEVRKAAKK